jgi:hypothetical protein
MQNLSSPKSTSSFEDQYLTVGENAGGRGWSRMQERGSDARFPQSIVVRHAWPAR